MAMTAAERAARYRENQKQQAGAERINIFAGANTVKRLRIYSDYHGITQSEALDLIIEQIWAAIPDEEKKEMDERAEVLEAKRLSRLAGDSLTGDLFA